MSTPSISGISRRLNFSYPGESPDRMRLLNRQGDYCLKAEFSSEAEKKTFLELLNVIYSVMAEHLPATVNSLYYYDLLKVLEENFKAGKSKIKKRCFFDLLRIT
jgi:hypothetical protein